jgi:putative DNA-invertase from lambdoid prophage Rac
MDKLQQDKTTRKVAIYCRVSTDTQDYEQQVNACTKYCEIKGWSYEIFSEIKSSTKERPVFQSVLKCCNSGKYSILMVFRIDRAWRNSRQFIMDFDMLCNRGVCVVSVMEGLDPSTPIGKAMMTILVALAELERVNISVATKQRLQALKNLGKTLGRPKGSKDTKVRRKSGYFMRYANKGGSRILVSENMENKNFDK